jgi:hypothetical protein
MGNNILSISSQPSFLLDAIVIIDPATFPSRPYLCCSHNKLLNYDKRVGVAFVPVTSSVNPTLPLKSAKLVAPVTSSVNPTLSLKRASVVDLIPSSIDPTLPKALMTNFLMAQVEKLLELLNSLILSSVDNTATIEKETMQFVVICLQVSQEKVVFFQTQT